MRMFALFNAPPPRLSRLFGDHLPFPRRQGSRPCRAALRAAELAQRDRSGILASVRIVQRVASELFPDDTLHDPPTGRGKVMILGLA